MRKIYEQPSVIQTPLMANAAVLIGSPTPPEFDPDPIEPGGGGD